MPQPEMKCNRFLAKKIKLVDCFSSYARTLAASAKGCTDGNPEAITKAIHSLGEIGAGEGIRTLDPNLGKVVLYP